MIPHNYLLYDFSDTCINKELESVRKEDLSRKDLETQFEARYLNQFCMIMCVSKRLKRIPWSPGQVPTLKPHLQILYAQR